MPDGLDPVFAIKIFAVLVTLLVVLGLVMITMIVKAQAAHTRRLKRVSRSRSIGNIDFEEVRLRLQKPENDPSLVGRLSDIASRLIPILDGKRMRENAIRANLEMTVGKFVVRTVIFALPLAALAYLTLGASLVFCVIGALVISMYGMDGYTRLKGDRMAAKFMQQLPDALDTIIRGIRSGLPMVECISTVGKEFEDPIRSHFAGVHERTRLGETLDTALWGVSRVIRRPEMDFLTVSVSIQQETGGSLAEALGGLSDLLRKRHQMRLKVKAISSEAKASALIIGALPFFMLGLLSLMAPEYVGPLFVDPRGQAMLGAGLVSIGLGAFVMWRMTQFEI
ncbi:MAG: type II secretion system F family protein [Pseudomonadota bacterium]